jgi:2-keto-3-deoxy-L-rhamnonate aldolase RhmA
MTSAVSMKERFRNGPALKAIFSIIPSTHVVEMIGVAGFEAVILDMEHGPYTIDSLIPLILAARTRGIFPMARVRSADPSLIGAALDAGAAGILVPQVTSAATAAEVVRAARFAPEGLRGVNPWVRAADYCASATWFADSNNSICIMAMIEGKAGLDALPDILKVPGLDGIFLGPVDMAQSLGVAGQPEHPTVIEAFKRTITQAAAAGVGIGVFAPNSAAAHRWLELGVNFVAVSKDTAVILDAFRRLVSELK